MPQCSNLSCCLYNHSVRCTSLRGVVADRVLRRDPLSSFPRRAAPCSAAAREVQRGTSRKAVDYRCRRLACVCPLLTLQHIAHYQPTMQLTTLAYGLLALFASQVSATALTYKLTANEKACFYTYNQDKGQKIAFYFAVRANRARLSAVKILFTNG